MGCCLAVRICFHRVECADLERAVGSGAKGRFWSWEVKIAKKKDKLAN